MRPEAGQGARKVKSCDEAGGDKEINPVISGQRINNCIPIHDPKENPAIQQMFEPGC